MKKLTLAFAVSILLSVAGFSQQPLYLNFRSHNEISDTLKYYDSYTDYDSARKDLTKIKNVIAYNNATWNMQVESNFIRAVIRWDKPTRSTNLLKDFDDLPSIEIDLHNHYQDKFYMPNYNPYNYADMNYLITNELGLTKRNCIGGFFWTDTSTWNSLKNGQSCHFFNGTSARLGFPYTPLALTGGGSRGDANNLYAYGAWRPSNANNGAFLNNDASSSLYFIGDGCHFMLDTATNPVDLANEIISYVTGTLASTTADGNTNYTASIMFNVRDISGRNYDIKIKKIITMLQPYVASGQIIWQTYSDKLYNTKTYKNAADSFQVLCNSGSVVRKSNIKAENKTNNINSISVFPNPASCFIKINSNNVDNTTYRLFNQMGQLMTTTTASGSTQIDVSKYSKGLYVLQCINSKGELLSSQKIIVQ
jgi:hypothetical protein